MHARPSDTGAQPSEGGDARDRVNELRWQQRLPVWARVLIVLAGLVVAGAAILKLSNFTVPGVLLGSVLVLFGWKGIPLFPSAPFHEENKGACIRQGLETIRRRFRTAVALGLICPSFVAGAMPLIPISWLPTLFFVACMPALACGFRFVATSCPRCDERFFGSQGLLHGLTRCQGCNLSISADLASAKQRMRNARR